MSFGTTCKTGEIETSCSCCEREMALSDGAKHETREQLSQILSESGLNLIFNSPKPVAQVFDVLHAYYKDADAAHRDVTTLPPSAYTGG